MFKLKSLIAGALLSVSLASPLPAFAAEAAVEKTPAATAETVAADAAKNGPTAPAKLDPAAYLELAQKATSAEPSANIDFSCNLASPLGQALAQISGSYVISDPAVKKADGLRPNPINPKTDNPKDNFFLMEGTLTFAIRSFANPTPGTNIPFYVKADQNFVDVYTYDTEKKKWTHYQQDLEKAKAEAVNKAADKATDLLSNVKIDQVVKDAPSTAETRSLTAEYDLKSLLRILPKLCKGVSIPETIPDDVARLTIKFDIDRKTKHITHETGDLTKFARFIAHSVLDNTESLDAMHRQMISSIVDTSTIQFESKLSSFGVKKNIMIPTAALETPITPLPEKKENKEPEKESVPAEESESEETADEAEPEK